MRQATLNDLIVAVGGRPVGVDRLDGPIEQVRVDSRLVRPGDVFWALPGAKLDGHRFVGEALARGAICCVARSELLPIRSTPHIAVADTPRSLQDFARWRRSVVDGLVIAVTGSNGKTTTRSMLHTTLSARFSGAQSPRNFNNHVGVPLSLLSIEPDHEFAVIEIGASHVGEISVLAELARPEIALVTSIAPAHLGDFGSMENIVRAKGELVEAVPSGGFVVLNGDDHRVRSLAARAACPVVTVGLADDNDLTAGAIQLWNDLLQFEIGPSRFSLRAAGRHHVTAALACVAVGREVGLTDQEIATGLSRFEPVAGRCRPLKIGPWTVIDDTYNANPASMQAACDLLREWNTVHRKWLVLGDMLSLGPESLEFHRQLGLSAATAGVDGLAAIGDAAPTVIEAARQGGLDAGCLGTFRDTDTLMALLDCWLEPGDVILVKGSRDMGMERIVAALRQLAESTLYAAEKRQAA